MKDHYSRVERIIKRIERNSDKIVKFEDRIEKIQDSEIRFQAQVAVLNYHRKFLGDSN